MGTTQFMNAALAAEKPIFGRAKINHTPPHPITHMVASNRRIVLVLSNRSIQRVDQSSRDGTMETIDITKVIGNRYKVFAAFIDPMGSHLMLSLKPEDPECLPDLLYIPARSGSQPSKPRLSNKIKGHLVTAVAFCNANTSSTNTGPILMGTTRGTIFEAEIASESGMFSSMERQWRQVYDLGRGQATVVTGLEYHRVPRSKKFFVLASTPTRLYQFQGIVTGDPETERPLLTHIFNDYINAQEQYIELPSSLRYSVLDFFYEPKDKTLAARVPLYPRSFGWMTEQGVYTGTIDPYANETVTVDCNLILLHDNPYRAPKGFVRTEFHAIVCFEALVRGVCLLNEQVVFEDDFDRSITGMCRDPVSGTIYVYSDYEVHKYNLDHEDKHIWRVFLEKSDFDRALKYCFDSESRIDEVRTRQASHLFDKGQFVESAEVYARTSNTDFEAVALKFLHLEAHEDALLCYLKRRLELIKPSEKTQLTMIVVWLVEIHLNMMGAKENAPRQTTDLSNENIEAVADALDHQTSEDLLALMRLPKVADCIEQNRNTFYSLLSSHGDKTNLIKFAHIMKDFDRVIRYHLQDGEYEPVLRVLETQLVSRGKADLMYQYGPTLMQTIPERFVDSIIAQGRRLTPLKLIPSLVVSSQPDQELQAIRYLEFCVDKMDNTDPPVHNYLLSLYVKHQEGKVMGYLAKCGTADVKYDVKYALRLVSDKSGLSRETVFLFCILGQLEEAVSLALARLDVDEAKRCLAFAPKNDVEVSRRLWMMIAGHVVEHKNDIRQAMEFLRECDGLVKVEDVLPFFPDFVTIDHFKDAICDSLQEYGTHIQELRLEMDEAYGSAERIRTDIRAHKSRYTLVRATEKCCECNVYLMTRPFHLFTACGHKFHTSCLVEAVRPHLSSARARKVDELLAELGNKPELDAQSVDSRSLKLSRHDQLRGEVDDLVASECIRCGDVMIRMIDEPFIEDADFDRVNGEWL